LTKGDVIIRHGSTSGDVIHLYVAFELLNVYVSRRMNDTKQDTDVHNMYMVHSTSVTYSTIKTNVCSKSIR